jgi:hypothetical protein
MEELCHRLRGCRAGGIVTGGARPQGGPRERPPGGGLFPAAGQYASPDAPEIVPGISAASSARIAMLSRSSAAHRARSRVNAAAKDSARAKIAHAVAASRAFFRRLYHVERLTPSASHGCFAGRLGPIPCALRHRSERKRAFSRRSASVIVAVFRVTGSPVLDLHPQRGSKVQPVARAPRRSLKKGSGFPEKGFALEAPTALCLF